MLEARATSGFVGHWMTKGLVNVTPGDPLFEAMEIMARQAVRHVLVVDDHERVVGILSNRDAIRSVMRSPDKRLELFGCKVRHVMTPMPLHTTTSDATLSSAAALMHEHKVSALPVIDGEAGSCGLITTDDVLAAIAKPEHVLPRPDQPGDNPS
jgi:CBS domain-containing protein